MTGKWPTLRGLIRAVRGQSYRKMERDDEALADLDRAIALNPKDASALASRGRAYNAVGDVSPRCPRPAINSR